jgi:hypothetical protein
MTPQDGHGRPETGMVTAELAVSLVTLVLVLAVALNTIRVGMDRTAAVSVAGALAREAAREGDVTTLWDRVAGGLPSGSTFVIRRDSHTVAATVRVPVRTGGVLITLPAGTDVTAVAAEEGR